MVAYILFSVSEHFLLIKQNQDKSIVLPFQSAILIVGGIIIINIIINRQKNYT